MNAVTYFADALSRERPLTEQDLDILCRALSRNAKGNRRLWGQADDRELSRLRRKMLTADQIAEKMGRTAWSVRSRIRALNRKERDRG
jgi:hypothetical protein